ncbi:invasion associated locus B family protein [Hyphomicrobium sp. 99]|uniref:invasion associated locus B family protein n=1 Tax=Hyphomicrobium sp. 99 TaxID=1163419 RepID=UPI0005F79AC8|nr:invasion associated locus B family protein [Hyphomicrobium sp. 99]
MGKQNVRNILFGALSLVLAEWSPALAAESVTRVNTYGDWSLMADANDPHLFCFVTSEPKTSEPQDAPREAPRAYISAWPKDGIRAEVSFLMGYRIKKNAQGTATVSPSGFKLFGASDRAYVTDSTQELKLVEAMRKGSVLTIAIASDRGANVTDTYSLNGIGQALQKLQETCF